ncbi:hypothetical protein ABFV99_13770 [Cytobacillus horneckiae]|uniref:hypothetical protein n=1 Tax=Cytobacillus horneckiae TaxID=549687 RepID=UPI0034CF9840
MIVIGSVIVIILLLITVYALLGITGLFNKVGKAVIHNTDKIKEKAAEEYVDDQEVKR